MATFHRGYLHPFQDGRHFLYGVGETPRTLTELAMCQCSDFIRSKSRWWQLHEHHDIRQKWAKEAAEIVWIVQASCGSLEVTLSKKQIQYVLDELSGYAALRDEHHRCEVSCADRIWKSDNILDASELASLHFELQRLSRHSPWSTNCTSVDIVDPFLHGMVYGRTMAYDYAYTPPVLRPVHCPSSTAYTVSSRFVCIPTSFSISTSAVGVPQAEALSYINNIDPSATSLYERIETVVSRFVPLFEHVLTDLHRNNPLRQRISGAYSYTDCHGEPDTPEHSDDEDERLTYERELRDWAFNRPINLPDVMQEGYTGDLEKRHFTVSLMETTIKVIVRVTEIRIQPGGPDYAGTPWHVEGMRNEHIVACAMYCTEMINLIPASIEFRMSVTAPHHFIPGDTGATIRTWGLDHLSPCNQHLGSVPMSPGLGVAFPNIYQHRLTSTCLENPHSEGSMTILGLYLMDPDLADGSSGSGWDLTPSTESVPPQQKEWIKRAVEESIDIRLPVEIVEQIINNVEGVMSEQEAEAFAREMREERELFWQAHDTYRFCLPFDVWAT